jgi:predicted DNA-binding transcriptional regulator AlpA
MAETRGEQATFEWAGQVDEVQAPEPKAEPVARRAARPRAARRPRKALGARAGGSPVAAEAPAARTPGASPAEAGGRLAAAPAGLPPDDELWDVHAAARFLKRSVSWVYHRAEDGSLPVRRLGGWGLRFIPGELRAWVESGGVAPVRRRE